MADNLIFSLFLPIALGIVMIGLGLHLTLADFKRVGTAPKAVVVALTVQTVLLPPVAFALAIGFGLPPELGLGLVLLAASPGGVTANLFSHLARGDVALNISLTAINSALALLTLPIWTALGLLWLMDSEQAVPPPTRKIVEVGLIVIVPVVIGMLLRGWKPALAEKLDKPIRLASTLILVVLIAAAVVIERETLATYAAVVGLAALIFNLVSLLAGYAAGRAARLGVPQSTAIAFEIGIHNGTLAIFVALHALQMPGAAVVPAIYSLLMYITGGLFAWWVLKRALRAA
ncbi:MAG TPA: bile acid:sodium symporter [Xanthomonadaceae bacterium]|jgi:BASS family bile acid:Na+ symporter|nr:bile acid:sodium symporter [Xanthomonadaceae bacterium]